MAISQQAACLQIYRHGAPLDDGDGQIRWRASRVVLSVLVVKRAYHRRYHFAWLGHVRKLQLQEMCVATHKDFACDRIVELLSLHPELVSDESAKARRVRTEVKTSVLES